MCGNGKDQRESEDADGFHRLRWRRRDDYGMSWEKGSAFLTEATMSLAHIHFSRLLGGETGSLPPGAEAPAILEWDYLV